MHQLLTKPVGRDKIIESLTPLPVCSLIYAPDSTGKRTVAEYLVRRSSVPDVDWRMFPQSYWTDDKGKRSSSENIRLVEPEFNMIMVRDLLAWSRTAPSSFAGRVAIIRLDHIRVDGSRWVASTRVCEALLKTLEEPPTEARFILLASNSVLSTVESRCTVVRSGLLSIEIVADILYRVSDLDQGESRIAAALGGGRVAPALSSRTDVVGAKESVLGLLASLASRDGEALIIRAKGWSDVHTEMLVRAIHERITGRYLLFSLEDLTGLTVSLALRLSSLLCRFQGSRSKVLVGALAAGVLKGQNSG